MSDKPSWDDSFLKLACTWAQDRSKDESSKVGAIIVRPEDRDQISIGYNGLPRGLNDDDPKKQERPLKYKYFEHGERNAIYNVARRTLKGCIMYVPGVPCTDCARGIIQVGIVEVIIQNAIVPERWYDDAKVSMGMLNEAGVKVRLANEDKNLTPEDVIVGEKFNSIK